MTSSRKVAIKYVSQASTFGYKQYVMVHAWWGMGNRSGMQADVQASWHDSTAHVQRFFPPKCRGRWKWHYLMTSLTSLLCILGVGIKVSMHETQGFSSVIHSFSPFVWFSWLVPQLGILESHRPSNSATSVPLEEWNYSHTGKCSLFVLPYILKVILGTLSYCALVFCKLVR